VYSYTVRKVLVLGSAGQIGSELTKYLRSRNYEVLEFDILLNSGHDLRIRNNPLLEEYVKAADFVYFLAFDVGGSHYLATYQDSYEFIKNNSLIMSNTFEILKSLEKPFVFASSTMADIHGSTYGLLKALGEKYTIAANGLPVKFWNVYGEEKDQTKFHVISDFILMAKERKEILMRTTGAEKRDFLHAHDCSVGLEAIMLNFSRISPKEKIHLASFRWNSILEVAELVASLFDAKIVPGAQEDNVHLGIRTEPDKFMLKFWNPTITLSEGISRMIESS